MKRSASPHATPTSASTVKRVKPSPGLPITPLEAETFQVQQRAHQDRVRTCRIGTRFRYYAVFDGHAGSNVVDYLYNNMHLTLARHLQNMNRISARAIKNRLVKSFAEMEAEIITRFKMYEDGGSTATVALMCDERLCVVAQAGDGVAFVMDQCGHIMLQADRHSCQLPSERKRFGPDNINHRGYLLGQVAPTRGFGNAELHRDTVVYAGEIRSTKDERGQYLFRATPALYHCDMENGWRLVIASDGFVTSDPRFLAIRALKIKASECLHTKRHKKLARLAADYPVDVPLVYVACALARGRSLHELGSETVARTDDDVSAISMVVPRYTPTSFIQ